MNKKYEANTIVAITVQTGKFHRRVSFNQLSNGKSYYSTENETLQQAIETHPFFKSGLISLASQENQTEPNEASANDEAEQQKEQESELKKVVVAGQSDAVDYLTEKYGISRSKLRSQKAIAEAGAVHGVEFVYN